MSAINSTTLEAAGKKYQLKFNTNAFCQLEESLGMSVLAMTETFSDSSKLGFKEIAKLIYAGTRPTHPEVTMVEVYAIMDKNLPEAIKAVSGAFVEGLKTLKLNKE